MLPNYHTAPVTQRALAEQLSEVKLRKAMESLKRTDREILEKKFVYGYSLDEIADQLGMPRSNVLAHLKRALTQLLDRLSAQPDKQEYKSET
jgi:RNA polymerase sigma factor (sigma-70 family)